MLSLLQSGHNHRFNDPIDVFLCVLGKNGSGVSGLTEQAFQISYAFFAKAFCRRGDPNLLLHSFACDHDRPLFVGAAGLLTVQEVIPAGLSTLATHEQGRSSIIFIATMPGVSCLCVIDWMSLQPVLVAHPTNVPPSTAGGACG